jgi:hypothetical protein
MSSMQVDSRNAELAVAIATGVGVSPTPLSPPERSPADKLRRRLLMEDNAEVRSLNDPGARIVFVLPDVGGATTTAKPDAVPQ